MIFIIIGISPECSIDWQVVVWHCQLDHMLILLVSANSVSTFLKYHVCNLFICKIKMFIFCPEIDHNHIGLYQFICCLQDQMKSSPRSDVDVYI